jgi:hypothetical protein
MVDDVASIISCMTQNLLATMRAMAIFGGAFDAYYIMTTTHS